MTFQTVRHKFHFQNKTIKAEKGKTLIWPAGFTDTHRGQISKKHVKYIVTGWIHDNYQIHKFG